jgi:hypothetical protein
LGALNFCRLVARPEPPMPSSSTETAQVEVSRAAHEEGTVPEAPARVNTLETPALLGATGTSVSPHVSGGRGNEASLGL